MAIRIPDQQRRRRKGPRAVGIGKPVTDLGFDAGHFFKHMTGGDQHGTRCAVGSGRVNQEPRADRTQAIAQRLLKLNRRMDQRHLKIIGHGCPRRNA